MLLESDEGAPYGIVSFCAEEEELDGDVFQIFSPQPTVGNTFSGEFPLWLSGLRTRHSIHEDAVLIPGLS